ncbi:PREDICTED: FUN14 domain-containing protein 1-like isoform X2 [Nicrophorus vespilloides]|uniref:FUN14 domain-containing protein 1-like isoform X2 n=1 Tax=Nicrophorus vespilloides TaxID=110193 RepID=A0ABM1M7S2_NICVS|nr:PREDICTED: FUN14 domain-containing protein 1-like isoform X2 [Nicrophorus vespilloides]
MPLFVRKTDKNHKNQAEIAKMDPNGKSIIDKIMEDISDGSTTKQLVLGTASGLITGLISMKVGKAVAMAVGGGIILLQVANENDIVKINWNKVNKKIDKVVDNVEEKISGQGPSLMDKITTFSKTHMSFSASFIGGFFIAIGCS